MTTARTYRTAHTPDQALDELLAMRGVQFDPLFVDSFVELTRTGAYVPDTAPEVYPDDLAGAPILIVDDDGIVPSTRAPRDEGR